MASRATSTRDFAKPGRAATASAHVVRCALVWAAVALAAGGLLSCSPAGNTFDNPNRTEPPPRVRISLWTVQDVASSTVLASGCLEEGTTSVPSVEAAPGQNLVFEVRVWTVEKRRSDSASGWWCSDEDVVSKTMVGWVENLSCWDYPSSGGVRTLSWEAIQTPKPAVPASPSLMSGTGYRMQLEVDHPGSLMFVPNGTCALDGHTALEVRAP